jgi:hypothetical protein
MMPAHLMFANMFRRWANINSVPIRITRAEHTARPLSGEMLPEAGDSQA